MPSFDHDGIDRQTYEKSNCGSTKPHDQHFHSPIGGLTLNCAGVAENPEDARVSRAEVQRILREVRERYARFGRGDDDIFRVLENRMIPLTPGEPVQFRELGGQRWFNGTYDGPVDNPDDPKRSGDVVVLSRSSRRVTVFLSSVRRMP